MNVDDIDVTQQRLQSAPDPHRPSERSRPEDPLRHRPARARHPRDVRLGPLARGRRVGEEVRRVTAGPRPFAEMEGQQRVRRLVGREMGRDVKDLQLPNARLNSMKVAGFACSVPTANSKNRSSRSKNAFSSASVRL